MAELDPPGAGQIKNDDLLSSGEAARAAFDFRQERKAARLAVRAQDEAEKKQASEAAPPDKPATQQNTEAKPNPGPGVPQQIYLEESKARLDGALAAGAGFVERLVWFWSNHFCVSADKGGVRPLCGAYEREAIRPYVTGKFADMLVAVESHPAMLLYLDNARSIGPNSFAGLRRNKGLNENLAREILELHTLGVRTGYSQDDVTNFAKVITGWSIVPPRQSPDRGGEFTFNPRMHEPGVQWVIGRDYEDRGFEQGRELLLALAKSPYTANHIARKLASHFVADDPPRSLVDSLAARFVHTKGDLKEISKALVTAPEAWDTAPTKLRRPSDWVISALRVCVASNHLMSDQSCRRRICSASPFGECLRRTDFPTTARPGWMVSLSGSTLPTRFRGASGIRSIQRPSRRTHLARSSQRKRKTPCVARKADRRPWPFC